jgi:DNA-binding transcriptional ArsR family regulator
MEQVVHAMRENGDEMTAGQIAEAIGADQTVVRSHLNRHKDTRYRKVNGNEWALIGEDDEDDDE